MKHKNSLTLKIYISKLKDGNILTSINCQKKRIDNDIIPIINKPKINLIENQFKFEILTKLKYQCKLYDKENKIILLREEINLIEDYMNNTLKF